VAQGVGLEFKTQYQKRKEMNAVTWKHRRVTDLSLLSGTPNPERHQLRKQIPVVRDKDGTAWGRASPFACESCHLAHQRDRVTGL
jgi:hypothetical protein